MPRESQAAKRARAGEICKRLAEAYPDARCALHFAGPFQLLVATILSAQCTDKMVNQVTPELFARFPDARAMAAARPSEIERLIQRTGFFRQKAKSILEASRDIVERFGGKVPRTLDDLVSLHGVGRKTANVVLGNAFEVPGLTVDTHMTRVNRRLGLTSHDDPVKIERDLMALVPEREWTLYSHRVIEHGRTCCIARRPECERCALRELCPFPRSRAAVSARRPAKRRSRGAR
ncbi:MAG TPA: endonuclease III [Myxococcota bacterium]|jgi:endonuclease-3|nr:endonuclease III [Myxococcota bacterium]